MLKDEVFLQILKQLNNNSNRVELTRLLQLMTVLSYLYKPTVDMILLSLKFLSTIYYAVAHSLADPFLNKLFCYLLNKLIKDRTRR